MQFGVASGNTLLAILDNFKAIGCLPNRAFGFDSFVGLPDEAQGVPRHNDWVKGAFNLIDEINSNKKIDSETNNIYDALSVLVDRFPQEYIEILCFVAGFYSDTLDSGAVKQWDIKPASFVDIDCDLYISAKQALDFIFENHLVADNCIIRYDDWYGTAEGVGGESKAHYETVEKYNAVFERLPSVGQDAIFRYKGRK